MVACRRTAKARNATLLVVVGVVASCGELATMSARRSLVDSLRPAAAEVSTAARLSIATRYRECGGEGAGIAADSGAAPGHPCGDSVPPLDDAMLSRAAEVAAAVRGQASPDALEAAALLDLLWGSDRGKSLARPISYLRMGVRLAGESSPLLTDLSASLLMRAEHTNDPKDLIEALEMADRALERDPHNASARYDAALALDRLAMPDEAADSWRDFVSVEPRTPWADAARRRLRQLERPAPAQSGSERPADPERARLDGWDHLLGDWGRAILAGDVRGAAERLAAAEQIGRSLVDRGGDATLARAVEAIHDQSGHAESERELARAHRAYADGQAAFAAADYSSALVAFREAGRGARHSAALRMWAEAYYASCAVYQRQVAEGTAVLRRLVARSDTMAAPAYSARVRWMLGTTVLRSGRYETAQALYEESARLFARAGEREHVGQVLHLAAEAAWMLGDRPATYDLLRQSLGDLRPYRSSVWRHNALWFAAQVAAADGFPRAAVRLQNEGVRAAAGTEARRYVAEATLARSRLLESIGRTAAAAADLDSARRTIDALPPGLARDWLRADIRVADATHALRADPRAAAATLDSVVSYFDSTHNELRMLPALVARADARLTAGDSARAAADLTRAVGVLVAQRDAIRRAASRASVLDATRAVFDRMVMMEVAAGRPERALAYMEQARETFGPRPAAARGAEPHAVRLQPGQRAIEYALIGDTLLTWVASDAPPSFVRSIVPQAELVATIDRVRTRLELRAEEEGVRPDLSRLYDWLLRPVVDRLGQSGSTLTIVADGAIAGVPFAALYDSAARRYLVEAHPLRVVGSLRDTLVQQRRRDGDSVLVVADPSFDAQRFPDLQRLAGASTEAREVRRAYPRATLLEGADATPSAFVDALARARVVHFAGHAVFDDERPEESMLVLAPERSAAHRAGTLSAAQVERLDLHRVELAVLSACQTIQPRAGRAGGFAGLAGAFMAAGARGVVGSLWRVDDRFTAALMGELHRAYRQSGSGAAALREAQLALLRGTDPTLRSPAAWGAFRYSGE